MNDRSCWNREAAVVPDSALQEKGQKSWSWTSQNELMAVSCCCCSFAWGRCHFWQRCVPWAAAARGPPKLLTTSTGCLCSEKLHSLIFTFYFSPRQMPSEIQPDLLFVSLLLFCSKYFKSINIRYCCQHVRLDVLGDLPANLWPLLATNMSHACSQRQNTAH